MVIINAYLGAGSGGGVPVGKCLLNVAWNPSDGNNKSGATVRAVIGSTTVTGTTDSSGNVSLLVGTGTCTVTVTPTSGTYTNLSASVTAESTTTKTVVINGQAGRKVVITVPYAINTVWEIWQGDNRLYRVDGLFNDTEVTLNDGDYALVLYAYGVQKIKIFTVSSTSTRIDCTDMTCLVTFRLPPQLAITMSVAGTALASNQTTVCVLRDSAALAYTGTVTTQLDGSAIATVTGGNMTPSGATLTVTPTITGARKIITASKTLNIPVNGYYKVLVIGGGGAGATATATQEYYAAAGGGGHVAIDILRLNAGNQTITIGGGGASSGASGGASSFGSLLSASGGSGGGGAGSSTAYAGGAGGAGGGGRGAGGNASFAGGGGAGYANANGGTAGPYGGAGGTGKRSASLPATAGASGKAVDNSDGFFQSTGSGYTGGTVAVPTGNSAGGGGGGYGAKGGNVPVGQQSTYGEYCGGGGGGIAGGDGGDGVYVKGTFATGGHGLGYGSGGAGLLTASSAYHLHCGGGGGGLYNISQSGMNGASGAVQIMWMG